MIVLAFRFETLTTPTLLSHPPRRRVSSTANEKSPPIREEAKRYKGYTSGAIFSSNRLHTTSSTDQNGHSVLPRQPAQGAKEALPTLHPRASWSLQPHPQVGAAGEKGRMATPRGKRLCAAEVPQLHAGGYRRN